MGKNDAQKNVFDKLYKRDLPYRAFVRQIEIDRYRILPTGFFPFLFWWLRFSQNLVQNLMN